MHLFFTDDSKQEKPTRDGMGSLLAIGGISLQADAVRQLESSIDEICVAAGIPAREEFKWSPARKLWMHANLAGEARAQFFATVLNVVSRAGATAIVVVEDTRASTATSSAATHEQDVVTLLLERINNFWRQQRTNGVVICDQHSGNSSTEKRLLTGCLDTVLQGTEYVSMDHILMNVVATPSDLSRLIQVADLVTSCTAAHLAGRDTRFPQTFSHIKPMLWSGGRRIGGTGLKIHPDGRYRNLYHWLLNDTSFSSAALPDPLYPYANDPQNC